MRLIPTEDQQQLIQAAAEFLGTRLGTDVTRRGRGADEVVSGVVWREAAALGLLATGLPEACGGLGLGLVEEYLVLREVGRVPSPGPFLPGILAAHVAHAAGEDTLAEALVSGETRAGLLVPDGEGSSGGEHTAYVIDTPREGVVLLLDSSTARLLDVGDITEPEPLDSLDPATPLTRARLAGTRPRAQADADAPAIEVRALVLTAALLSGIAEGTLAASVAHAKVREQFGRPIGVNQAVKHRCADMALEAEAAASQSAFAAAAFDGGRPDAEYQALAAVVMAARAARENAAANVQLHGGMGFTAESDAHLFVKRAEILEHVFGSRATHLERLVALPNAQ